MYYEDLVKAINTVPITQLLGLYAAIVENIVKKKVFVDNKKCKEILLKSINRIIKENSK